MPSISILFKNKILSKYQISKGDTLLIGRNAVNDIVIDNPLVSNQHAKIDSDGNGYLYVDLQSSNGSYKDGQMINSHWLNDGDSITVGNHILKFSNPKIIKPPEKQPTTLNKTVKIDTKKIAEIMKLEESRKNHSNKSKSKNVSKQRKPVAVLSYLTGKKTLIQLSGNLIKIGRDPKSDVLVNGFGLGQTAAVMNKMTDGWYISYVGGFSKPRVNDTILKKPMKLKNFDIIKFGSTKLQFLLGYR